MWEKSKSKDGRTGGVGLPRLVLFREKYQVAPFELPLISFPWVKKEEVVENNSRAREKRREEVFEDGGFSSFWAC